jgi:16S rRNA (guanine527-N7)-methyltransferase
MKAAANLEDGLKKLGLTILESQQLRLLDYLAMLEKWNRVVNLTAIRDPIEMIAQHLFDSLTLVPHLVGRANLADVGSGAGLPGIPLALARPDMRVTLIESNQKKAAFLRQAKIELGLDNVEVQAVRAEMFKPETLFEVVVSRAFAELDEFVRLSGHLLAPRGVILAMKGLYPYEELTRLPSNCSVREVIPLEVPQLEATRHLVVLVTS